jgi:DNA-damage-inducible protein D
MEFMSNEITPFEQIRRTNPAGNEFWSSRDFARVLDYNDYRNFEAVIEKARTACFNSGQRVEDHFVEITELIEIGKGGQRPVKTVMMSRYACYLIIQNADPARPILPSKRVGRNSATRKLRSNAACCSGRK